MQTPLKKSAVLSLTGWVGVIVINTLAVLLPINNMSTGAISDLYPNLFVPAGFTFSIWSLIYLWLLAFAIYTLWYAYTDQHKRPSRDALLKLMRYFIITCIINVSWIFLWHYLQVYLSVLVMLAFLTTLVLIYRHLQTFRSSLSATGFMFVHLPFSVYLGWISVATIANITAAVVASGWHGGALGEANWAAIMIIIAGLLGAFFLIRFRDRGYALVIIWALYGISFKQADEKLVENTAQLTELVLVLLLIYSLWKWWSKKNPEL